jgi:hypothetical protein
MIGFDNGAASSGSPDRIGAIDELWFQAMAGGFHGASCRCFGGSAVTLDAQSLEADILDYLLPRYTAEHLDPLVDALKKRRTDRTGSFIDWLSKLSDTTISPNMYTRLIDDIGNILSSIGNVRAGFACS